MWTAAGITLIASGAVLLARSQYEREQLSVEYTDIVSKKLLKDCTLVFLSDLHSHQFGKDNRRLIEEIDRINPDLVLIGGDMMVAKGSFDTKVPLSLLKNLTRKYPVYYGNGNHENRIKRQKEIYGTQYEEYVKKIRAMGVVVLEDRTENVRQDLSVSGIDLKESCYEKFGSDQMTKEEIQEKLGVCEDKRYHIMLCHSPLSFPACRQWGADLTLSGHFHGGTIRLPLLGGVMTPQFQFFLPWCAGTFWEEDSCLLVCRGLGTHSINIRLNNKPQLVAVRLKRSK